MLVSRKLGAFAVGRPYPQIQPIDLNPDPLKAFEGIFALDDKQTLNLSVQGTQWVSVRDGGRPAALIPDGR